MLSKSKTMSLPKLLKRAFLGELFPVKITQFLAILNLSKTLHWHDNVWMTDILF
jgi:hypothetical protein